MPAGRELNEFYRRLVEGSAHGVWATDLDGRTTYANAALAALVRWPLDHVLASSMADFIEPADLALVRAALHGGAPHDCDVHLRQRDGGRVLTTFWSFPVDGPDGGPGWAAIVHEVTAERQMATDLEVSDDRLQLALRAARMFTWEQDLTSRGATTSAGAREILGLSPDEPFTSEAVAARMPAEDRDALESSLARLREPGARPDFSLDFRVRQDDGTQRWMRTTGQLQRGPGVRVCGVTQDVTEEKRLAEALLRGRKLEGIGRLAGGIAHDFNNLITAILTSVSFLESSGEQPSEDIEVIRTAASRAGYLVQQLQRFSGQHRVDLTDLDINDVVLDLETILHRLCGEHCRMLLDLEPEPWPVRGDAGALGQVLIQLIANASDSLSGGGTITVSTANLTLGSGDVAPPGDYVELAVTDDGAGLDDAARQHLFEPFFSTKEGGLGLGLASSYGTVERHAGHVAVERAPDHGTRIAVRLPRAEVDEAPGPAPTTGTSETILLVEDNELVRRTVVRGLAELGFDLLVAADGEEALEVAAQHAGAIDVLVTDLVMPGMNGADLAARLRAARPDIRVIFVSGHTPEMVERRGGGAELGSFLAKPYTVALLRDRIAALRPPPT